MTLSHQSIFFTCACKKVFHMSPRAIKSHEFSHLALNDFDSAQPGSAEDWEYDLAVAGHLEKYILPMFYKLC